MTPWQLAKQWQEDNDATTSFEELLGAHLSSGYIWNSPQVFLLAGEVRWNAEEETFESGDPNCWFVRLAACERPRDQETKRPRDLWAVRELLRVAPKPHQYVGWCRRQQFEPRIYRWDKLIKKTGGQ
jgi:hypothetical protein